MLSESVILFIYENKYFIVFALIENICFATFAVKFTYKVLCLTWRNLTVWFQNSTK